MTGSPLADRQVVEHFDRLSTSGDWSRLYAQADGRTYHFHVRRARVLDLLPERLGLVLDVGCGSGPMVEPVLARGGRFVGVDVSAEMAREGTVRHAGRAGVTFIVGSSEALPLVSHSCDHVIAMGLIEYLKTASRALAEVARVLVPGGVAVVTVPKRSHINVLTVALATPVRVLGRAAGLGTGDLLPRLRLQPDELDAVAAEAGLVPDGGAQYHYTALPYPFTRAFPGLSMRVNGPLERLSARRDPITSYLASGFVGRYRKP